MAKIITDMELSDVVRRIIQDDLIDEVDLYERFLADLTDLLTTYLGGERGNYIGPIDLDPDEIGFNHDLNRAKDNLWTVSINPTEEVPDDGGIWITYDPDVNEEWVTAIKELQNA